MHRYLRAIGFAGIETKSEEITLLRSMELSPPYGERSREKHERTYAGLRCETGKGIGVILQGYRDPESGEFVREFYFPYVEGKTSTPMGSGYIRRLNDKEAYAVLSEDGRLGAALIFYMINGILYRERVENNLPSKLKSFALSGLGIQGTVLLPIQKTKHQIARINATNKNRDRMLAAAREGDEAAMESLTMEDITLYGQISRRMLKEDVYSIVDSCFMPTGVECDSYMVIGEILECERITNFWTREKVYQMQIASNGLELTLCINERDITGEPAPGRRFKGDIWLQGMAEFGEK